MPLDPSQQLAINQIILEFQRRRVPFNGSATGHYRLDAILANLRCFFFIERVLHMNRQRQLRQYPRRVQGRDFVQKLRRRIVRSFVRRNERRLRHPLWPVFPPVENVDGLDPRVHAGCEKCNRPALSLPEHADPALIQVGAARKIGQNHLDIMNGRRQRFLKLTDSPAKGFATTRLLCHDTFVWTKRL